MAKALGTTVEEEHREGIHKLAKVCLMSYTSSSQLTVWSFTANKRPSRSVLHGQRATRSHRMV